MAVESMPRVVVIGPASESYRGGIAQCTSHLVSALRSYNLQGGNSAKNTPTVRHISWKRMYPLSLIDRRLPTGRDRISVNNNGWSDYTASGEAANEVEYLLDLLVPSTWKKVADEIVSFNPTHVIFTWVHPIHTLTIRSLSKQLRERTNAELCTVCHNVLPHERIPGASKFVRMALSNMHRILVHSKQELDIAAQLFPNSKTEQLDMPAVSLKTSTENSCRSEGSLFFDHDGPLALFFGTVRHYKGVDILIRAVSELRTHRPDLRVLIAGEPFGRRGRRIKFLIKLLRLENMVECDFRYIPDSELSLLLDRTTIVVLPFRSITQSASVMLARKHGVPVVTTNLPALQDSAIGDPGIFLVQPDDPRAVASGMLKALEVADGKIHPESELAPKWKDYANRIVPVFEREQFRQAVA